MDLDDCLSSILKNTAWLREAHGADLLAPGFRAEAPPLVPLPDQRQDGEGCVPVLDVEGLAIPLGNRMAEVAAALRGGGSLASVDSMTDAQLAADPLVAALVEPLVQCGLWAPRRSAVPALTLAWIASSLLAGKDLGVVRVDRSAAAEIGTLVAWLGQQSPEVAGKALSRLGLELSGRLSAAVSLAAEVAPDLAQNLLLQRVATDPLVLCQARGSLDLDRDLPKVAALLGLQADLTGLGMVRAAVKAATQASEARRAKGKGNGSDAALAALAGGWEAERVLMDPVAGPFAIGAMPELCSPRELRAAGVGQAAAKLLTRPPGASALAAAWSDLLQPLLGWDLLSTLVDRILPLAADPTGAWRGPAGPAKAGARAGLLVPRKLDNEVQHCVVAVRLSGVQRGLRQAATSRGQSGVGLAAREWRRFTQAQAAPAAALLGDHGVAAFASAIEAWRFALAARATLSGPRELALLGPGAPVTLSSEHGVAVGLAWGPVEGGSDGQQASLSGSTVADAVVAAGLAGGAIPGAADPLGQRAAGLTAQGFTNTGLVATGALAERLFTEMDGARRVLHRQGEGRAAAGIAQDFRLYPVMAWWEAEGGKVGLSVALVDPPGASPMVELKLLARDAFADFHRSDAEAARRAQAAPSRAAAPPTAARTAAPTAAPAAAAADPFAEDPFATEGPAATPAAGSPGPALERVDSVFGFTAESATDEIIPAAVYDEALDADDAGHRSEDLDMGLLDAFSQDGATGDTPILGAFGPEHGDSPVIGKLALMDDEEPFETDGHSPVLGPDIAGGATPLVAIEDDWEDDEDDATVDEDQFDEDAGVDDAFALPESGWDDAADADVQDDSNMAEGVLTDDFDDAGGPDRQPELDMLQDPFAFEAPPVDEADPFGFAPTRPAAAAGRDDGAGFFDAEEYTGFQDELGRAAPDRAKATVEAPEAPADDDGFSFDYDPDVLDDGGNTASGLWRSGDSLSPQEQGGRGAPGALAPEPTLAPPLSPAPAPAPAPAADDPLLNELVRMFKDYMVAEQGGGFIFGIRDGSRLRDAQRFSTGGDAQAAYGQFLQYKIRNGFVTEANKVVDISKDEPVHAIDGSLLRRAYVEVAR